ncbi:MAG: PQQ-binding-like beta-propeller repeat protein [Fimbriimonadales bacterium]|nr:PQQ-binding-like beta-propeller repeat protein [Fimbriimonadales bacterium]
MRTIAGLGLSFVLGIVSSWAQLQPGAPWPSLGKDYQNTRCATSGAPTNGSIRWNYQGTGWSQASPVVAADGTIYYGTSGGIHAVRPNGQLRWRWFAGYSAATSTPAIGVDGTVYALVNPQDAILVALNPANGSLLWSVYLGGTEVRSSPAIGPDGRIYVTNGQLPGGYLYCINPNGTIAWRRYLDTEANSTPCFGDDGTIYVGSARHLNAVAPNGTILWRFHVFYPVQGTIARWGNRLFFGAWDMAFRSVLTNGQISWTALHGAVFENGASVNAERVYAMARNGELRAYTHTGTLLWRANRALHAGIPTIGADGTIYITGGTGATRVAAVNPANGLERWNVTLTSNPNPYMSVAIGADGTVYAVEGGGRLTAFGPLGGFLWAGGDVDGWNGDYEGRNAIVQFYQDDELKYEMVAPLNADGTVELQETPVGVHDVKIRIHNSLFGRVSNVHLEVDQPAQIQVRLLNGDVDANNIVDDADLLYILLSFGSHAPEYDLNGDDVIDDSDLLIVLFNFGAVGE